MNTIDNRAPLHSFHVRDAIRRLDAGDTMKGIKETLSAYRKQIDVNLVCIHYGESMTATRKADYRGHLCNLYKALKGLEARPAEPVPEITPEQRAEHLQHAAALRGVLKAHGIDPQDWEACMNYLCDGSGLRYMVKIYVDYVYNCTEPGITLATAQALGYTRTHDEIMIDLLQPRGVLTVTEPVQWVGIDPALPGSERTVIHTVQETRATLSKAHQQARKSNRFPRGKCAARMFARGWWGFAL